MSIQNPDAFGYSCWWASRRVYGNNSFHIPVSIGYIKTSPANVQPASKTCRSDETKRADRAGEKPRLNARMKLPRPLHEETKTQFSQLPLHFRMSRADRTRQAARTNA
ncbi:hypothetical protein CSAL01_05314 [Colletotrichum salicis]|uniref:Uncharacterized protein n=1 Tax=Colletotrichum salicis TaxID=1209931 RepID=A0A135V0N0_9PEZI|nr:hypothetical protein CSAL01_05314 [Colletotrichum salicis]